jgi:ABC-2 type transport system permease protein
LRRAGGADNSLLLIVLRKESVQALAALETLAALQKAVEGRGSWISDVRAVQEGGIQKQSLPTWVLMVVLLVGFIILPAQVAEEKEKKLLLALLQTPMRETEWLGAKILSGMILISVALMILHLLGRSAPENMVGYLAVIAVGSFCFCSYGVLLGLLCRTQASARTLGVLFYLPHLIPSALADFSPQLSAVAPLLPSYQLFEPVKAILLQESGMAQLFPELIYLAAVGLVAVTVSCLLIKKRWLMS